MSVLPNFFIVGAAKSGTSSLAAYLAQHPEIGFPLMKEPNYFALKGRDLRSFPGPAHGDVLYELLLKWSITDENSYRDIFEPLKAKKAIGEASVRYLYNAEVPARIAQMVPNAKIIILLRNPVDRLWSHYAMMKARYHLEPATLEEAVLLEPKRMEAGWDYDWHYVGVSQYHPQLTRYMSQFGPENVRIYFHDAFIRDPIAIVQDIFQFLAVDMRFVPDLSHREKVGYSLRMAWVDKFWFYPHRFQKYLPLMFSDSTLKRIQDKIAAWNRVKYPELTKIERVWLRRLFAEDISRTEALLARRLTW